MLNRDLVRLKIRSEEHDLLAKEAYMLVRWAFAKFQKDYLNHAIERMKIKFPDTKHRDTIEEIVTAMNFDMVGRPE